MKNISQLHSCSCVPGRTRGWRKIPEINTKNRNKAVNNDSSHGDNDSVCSESTGCADLVLHHRSKRSLVRVQLGSYTTLRMSKTTLLTLFAIIYSIVSINHEA